MHIGRHINSQNIQGLFNALDSDGTGVIQKESIEQVFKEHYKKRLSGISDYCAGLLLAFNCDIAWLESELRSLNTFGGTTSNQSVAFQKVINFFKVFQGWESFYKEERVIAFISKHTFRGQVDIH